MLTVYDGPCRGRRKVKKKFAWPKIILGRKERAKKWRHPRSQKRMWGEGVHVQIEKGKEKANKRNPHTSNTRILERTHKVIKEGKEKKDERRNSTKNRGRQTNTHTHTHVEYVSTHWNTHTHTHTHSLKKSQKKEQWVGEEKNIRRRKNIHINQPF